MLGWFRTKQVELTLIDADTERVIAKSMYSKEQIPRLPETFALSTKIDIGDQSWTVVRSEPLTKSQL